MDARSIPDHPVIANMERTGHPDGKWPEPVPSVVESVKPSTATGKTMRSWDVISALRALTPGIFEKGKSQ